MRINRTQDPVLKDRVVFIGESHPVRQWVITSIVIIIASLATLVYFYFDTFSSDHSWFPETKTVTPPLAANDTTEVSIAPITTTAPPSLEEPNQINSQVAEANHHEITTAPPVNLPNTNQSTLEQQPVTTKDNTVSPISSSFQEPVTVPTEEETIISPPVSEPVITEEVVVATPQTAVIPETTTPLANSAQIERLLTKANTQIRRTRLTSPQGDNAYETYQALLKVAPQQAQSVLDAIIAWYYEQGQKYLSQDRLTRPKPNNAYHMYQKIHELAPQHPSATALWQSIMSQLQYQFDQQFQQGQFLTPPRDNAYATYQEIRLIAPQSHNSQQLLDKIIEQLFVEAERQLAEQKYTTPSNDNAADTYQKILTITPNNIKAQQGIQTIIQKYYQWALRRYRQGRYKASSIWLERGLHLAPDDPKLQQLKQDIADKLSQ